MLRYFQLNFYDAIQELIKLLKVLKFPPFSFREWTIQYSQKLHQLSRSLLSLLQLEFGILYHNIACFLWLIIRITLKLRFFSALSRSSHRICSVTKDAPAYSFIKKETLTHVFSCEFCEISKSTFFTEHIQATASV